MSNPATTKKAQPTFGFGMQFTRHPDGITRVTCQISPRSQNSSNTSQAVLCQLTASFGPIEPQQARIYRFDADGRLMCEKQEPLTKANHAYELFWRDFPPELNDFLCHEENQTRAIAALEKNLQQKLSIQPTYFRNTPGHFIPVQNAYLHITGLIIKMQFKHMRDEAQAKIQRMKNEQAIAQLRQRSDDHYQLKFTADENYPNQGIFSDVKLQEQQLSAQQVARLTPEEKVFDFVVQLLMQSNRTTTKKLNQFLHVTFQHQLTQEDPIQEAVTHALYKELLRLAINNKENYYPATVITTKDKSVLMFKRQDTEIAINLKGCQLLTTALVTLLKQLRLRDGILSDANKNLAKAKPTTAALVEILAAYTRNLLAAPSSSTANVGLFSHPATKTPSQLQSNPGSAKIR